MNNEHLKVFALVAVILGGTTLLLSQTQYNNAYYCNDDRIVIGVLQNPTTLYNGTANETCFSQWNSLEKLCGKFQKGKHYTISFTTEYCDQHQCYPANCKVS